MLMNHADSILIGIARAADIYLLAVDKNLALVGIINPREDVHQRRLSAAVFAKKRKNLAFAHIKRDMVIGGYLAEVFGYVSKLNGI